MMVRIKVSIAFLVIIRFIQICSVANSQNLFQELQRRLDQTLGKPGNYHHGIDKEGHIKPMTIGARLYRLENQVNMSQNMKS